MNGKSKCKILKDIRRQIAAENDIEYVTTECKYQGECTGTCPKCEAEVRYLEQELENRQKTGKAIAVAGIAAALVIGAAGCGSNMAEPSDARFMGDLVPPASTSQTDPTIAPTHADDYMGDMPIYDPTLPEETEPSFTIPDDIPTAGVPAPEDYLLPGAVMAP
ncbi:MAG: hypothetical protein IJW14_02055 [Oscillospiraceae bacterium]|nr:hypothetical protein [Oscillospiraceae bacterium]